MPALAVDWCCGDGGSKASTFTESKLAKNQSFAINRPVVETMKENVDKGIRYLNGATDDIPPPKVSLFDPNRLRLHWTHRRSVGAGLSNLGNTCFLNSVLQCLVYTPPLAQYLAIDEHKAACKVKDFCMVCVLQDHLSRSQRGGQSFKPLQILQNLRNIAKSLTWGQQEDAHEFLRYVVDSMQKSCLVGTNGLDKYSKETTFVYHVFSGYLRSQVKCLRCMHASNTYDPFLDISVDIKDVFSLEQALAKFVSPEKLDIENAYKCERCKVRVAALKRFSIHRCSNVLTVHLKRFDMSRPLGCKISRHIKFPLQMNIRPYMSATQGEPVHYVLYGVLVHSGFSCNSGHYYSYVKAANGQWYCMNDTSVTMSTPNTVQGAEAYILFYVRMSKSSLTKSHKPHTITHPVQQNGSGDHQGGKIIGPQLPSASNISKGSAANSSGILKTQSKASSAVSSSVVIKSNGVKRVFTTNNQNIKGKDLPKVLVPSLVPYIDPTDSDAEDTLEIDESSPKEHKQSTNGESMRTNSEKVETVKISSGGAAIFQFKPRSLLKPAVPCTKVSLQDTTNTSKRQESVETSSVGMKDSSGASSNVLLLSTTTKHNNTTEQPSHTNHISTLKQNGSKLPDNVESTGSVDVSKTTDVVKDSFTKTSASTSVTCNTPNSAQTSKEVNRGSSRQTSPKCNNISLKRQSEHSQSPSRYPKPNCSQYNKHHVREHSQSLTKPSYAPERSSSSRKAKHKRSWSPQRARYSRSRSPQSKSNHRYRNSRSRSPRRSRHTYRSRSPRRSRNSRSPRKYRQSRSPRRSRKSPPRSKHSRSPRTSRCSRSPHRSKHLRSPHRSRHSRSPERSRQSRSPHRSRQSRPPHRYRHSRSPEISSRSSPKRSRYSGLKRASGYLNCSKASYKSRHSPSSHKGDKRSRHRTSTSSSPYRRNASPQRSRSRSASTKRSRSPFHKEPPRSKPATSSLPPSKPRSCDGKNTHPSMSTVSDEGEGVAYERKQFGASHLTNGHSSNKLSNGKLSDHTLSKNNHCSDKEDLSNSSHKQFSLDAEETCHIKNGDDRRKKKKEVKVRGDEMRRPLLSNGSDDESYDYVGVYQPQHDTFCRKESGDGRNEYGGLSSHKRSSFSKKLSRFTEQLKHSKKS